MNVLVTGESSLPMIKKGKNEQKQCNEVKDSKEMDKKKLVKRGCLVCQHTHTTLDVTDWILESNLRVVVVQVHYVHL